MKGFKRIREGGGTNQISARDINMVFKILEGLEGIGCRVVKGESGKWFIVVDGVSTDVEQPEGTTKGSDPDQFPDGTEIWGAVEYDQTYNKFVQFKLVWSAATRTFAKSATATDIIALDSHASQHI